MVGTTFRASQTYVHKPQYSGIDDAIEILS